MLEYILSITKSNVPIQPIPTPITHSQCPVLFQIANKSNAMSTKSKGKNNIKSASSDNKNVSIAEAIKKIGGQHEADKVLVHWDVEI